MLKVAAALIVAAAAFGCNDKEDEPNPNLNHNLSFEITIEDITASTAKVKVTHNGAATDTWYGLLTDQLDKTDDQLIEEARLAFLASSATDLLRTSRSYVNVVKELSPATVYKYIAFGLSEEGEVYGYPAVEEFTTAPDSTGGGDKPIEGGMRENSAWSVEYIGEGVIDEVECDHIVKVTSVDTNTYVLTVVFASEWDVYKLPELADFIVDDMKLYVEDYNNRYGTSYTIANLLHSGTIFNNFDLSPGYYRALALGVDAAGSVSGLYAISEPFEVQEEVPTQSYSAWLGNWEIVGNDENVCTVNVTKKEANKSYYLNGWEGVNRFDILVDYDESLDALFIYSQLVAEDVDFGEEYGRGNIYLYGADRNGSFYTTEEGDYGIAIAGILDGGQRAIVRYGGGVPEYPKFDRLFFAAKIGDVHYNLAEAEANPQMPAAMNPLVGRSEVERLSAPVVALDYAELPVVWRLGERVEPIRFSAK